MMTNKRGESIKKDIDESGFVAKNFHLDKDRWGFCHAHIDLVL